MGRRMTDREPQTVTPTPGGSWWLWLRVLGLLVLGAVSLFVVSLPELADESQSPTPAGLYLAWLLVIAAVVSGVYLILRRSAPSRRRALLTAFIVVVGSYGLLVFVLVPLLFFVFSP